MFHRYRRRRPPRGQPGGTVTGPYTVSEGTTNERIGWYPQFSTPTTGGTVEVYEVRSNNEARGITDWAEGPSLENINNAILLAAALGSFTHPSDTSGNGTIVYWVEVRAKNSAGYGLTKRLSAPD